MIKIKDIQKILKLTLLSGYIKNVKPINLLIVGKAGIGKTEILKSFKNSKSVFLTDLNYSGLIGLLIKKKSIKHLIIPDFLKITMKKRSTTDNLISLLNSLMEEGLGQIEAYFKHDFKNRKIGLITSTTKASFVQNKKLWNTIGFIDRTLLCSYAYSKETIEEIKEYINKEEFEDKTDTETFKKLKPININSTKLLNSYFNKKVKRSLRSLKQFQTLAKCNALSEGRNKVLKKDVNEILRLCKYLNEDYTEI